MLQRYASRDKRFQARHWANLAVAWLRGHPGAVFSLDPGRASANTPKGLGAWRPPGHLGLGLALHPPCRESIPRPELLAIFQKDRFKSASSAIQNSPVTKRFQDRESSD